MTLTTQKVKGLNDGRNYFPIIIISILVIAALVIAGVVWHNSSKGNEWSDIEESVPANLSMETTSEGNGQGQYITFSTKKDVKHIVSIFTDPRCPVCKKFEQEHADDITKLVERGDVAVRLHMMTFLDESTKSDYSNRMVQAINILSQKSSADVVWKFYNSMWNNQPTERTDASKLPTNEEIAESARKVGAKDDVVDAIKTMKTDSTQNVNKSNIEALEQAVGSVGTPNVFINGVHQPNALSPSFFNELLDNKAPEGAGVSEGINTKNLLKINSPEQQLQQ